MANDKTDILVDVSIVPKNPSASNIVKSIENDVNGDVNNFSIGISLKTGTANILQGSSTEINNLRNTFVALQLPDSVFQLSNKITNEQRSINMKSLLLESESFNAGAVLEIYFSIILFLIAQGESVDETSFDRLRKQIPVVRNNQLTHTVTNKIGNINYKLLLQLTSRGTTGAAQKRGGTVQDFVGPNATPINSLPINVLDPFKTMMKTIPTLPMVKLLHDKMSTIKSSDPEAVFDISINAIGSTVAKDDVESSKISLDAFEVNNLLNNIYEHLKTTDNHQPIWDFLSDMMLGSTKTKWMHFDRDFAYFDSDILEAAKNAGLKFVIQKYNRTSRSGYHDLGLAFDIIVVQNGVETTFPVFRLWPQRHDGYSTSFRVECSNKKFTDILNKAMTSSNTKIVDGKVVTNLNFKSPKEKTTYIDQPSAFVKPENIKDLVSTYYRLNNKLSNSNLSKDEKADIKNQQKKIKAALSKVYKK
jgi:hypothetical protein